jgi:hypothetical protein
MHNTFLFFRKTKQALVALVVGNQEFPILGRRDTDLKRHGRARPGSSRPSTFFGAENDRKGAARSKRFVPEALAPFAAPPGHI